MIEGRGKSKWQGSYLLYYEIKIERLFSKGKLNGRTLCHLLTAMRWKYSEVVKGEKHNLDYLPFYNLLSD
jgi:hypothetical protein